MVVLSSVCLLVLACQVNRLDAFSGRKGARPFGGVGPTILKSSYLDSVNPSGGGGVKKSALKRNVGSLQTDMGSAGASPYEPPTSPTPTQDVASGGSYMENLTGGQTGGVKKSALKKNVGAGQAAFVGSTSPAPAAAVASGGSYMDNIAGGATGGVKKSALKRPLGGGGAPAAAFTAQASPASAPAPAVTSGGSYMDNIAGGATGGVKKSALKRPLGGGGAPSAGFQAPAQASAAPGGLTGGRQGGVKKSALKRPLGGGMGSPAPSGAAPVNSYQAPAPAPVAAEASGASYMGGLTGGQQGGVKKSALKRPLGGGSGSPAPSGAAPVNSYQAPAPARQGGVKKSALKRPLGGGMGSPPSGADPASSYQVPAPAPVAAAASGASYMDGLTGGQPGGVKKSALKRPLGGGGTASPAASALPSAPAALSPKLSDMTEGEARAALAKAAATEAQAALEAAEVSVKLGKTAVEAAEVSARLGNAAVEAAEVSARLGKYLESTRM